MNKPTRKFWAVVLVGSGTLLEMWGVGGQGLVCFLLLSHLTQEHLIQMSKAGIFSRAITINTGPLAPHKYQEITPCLP